jgi:hypothetical protein
MGPCQAIIHVCVCTYIIQEKERGGAELLEH